MLFAYAISKQNNPHYLIDLEDGFYGMIFTYLLRDKLKSNTVQESDFNIYTRDIIEKHFDLSDIIFLTRDEFLILDNIK